VSPTEVLQFTDVVVRDEAEETFVDVATASNEGIPFSERLASPSATRVRLFTRNAGPTYSSKP